MGSSESAAASLERDIRPSAVTDRALKHPLSISLSGKRVVLASASPRRKEILVGIGRHKRVVRDADRKPMPVFHTCVSSFPLQ